MMLDDYRNYVKLRIFDRGIMKKISYCLNFIILFTLLFGSVNVYAAGNWPEGVDIECLSACVMEIDTGTILYEKDMDMVNYPASITKILTCKLALENSDLDETVTFSEDAVYKNEGDTSHIWRDIGEEMTMEQCLYGMMLASANECAWAIGEHVSGSMDEFVDLMNTTASELGCTNTHFNNPNGLPDEEHYTSAHDMALIASSAYKNETFRIICSTKTYTIPETNKHSEPTYLANHHKMLFAYQGDSTYVKDYCTGGKTGYTIASGSTLVTFGEKNGLKIVCVVMNGKSPAHYLDTINLMDYCFENFQTYRIADNINADTQTKTRAYLSDSEESFAAIDDTSIIVLPVGVSFGSAQMMVDYVDIEEDENIIGRMEFEYSGKEVGSADIYMTGVSIDVDIESRNTQSEAVDMIPVEEEEEEEEEEEQSFIGSILDNFNGLFTQDSQKNEIQIKITPWFIVLIVGVIVLIVLIVILIRFIASHMYIIRRKRAEKRAEKQKLKGATFVSGKRNKWGRGGGLHF